VKLRKPRDRRPPRRKGLGLTDEQRFDCYLESSNNATFFYQRQHFVVLDPV